MLGGGMVGGGMVGGGMAWQAGGKEWKDKQKDRTSSPSHSLFLFRIIPCLPMLNALHTPLHSCVWRL